MSYNKKTHLRQNIDAIRIALYNEKEHRYATSEEEAILRSYSGFGGIKAIINHIGKPEHMNRWQKS